MNSFTYFTQVQDFLKCFHLQLPIIQAPMAGADNNALAIKVATLGAMGSRGMGYTKPSVIKEAILQLKQATKIFQINLFLPSKTLPSHQTDTLNEKIKHLHYYLKPYYEQFGLDNSPFKFIDIHDLFKQQLQVALDLKVPYLSFVFGLPKKEVVDSCHAAGIKVIATANTIAEAKALEEVGCDAMVLQGLEAGGHRGGFLADDLTGQMPLLDLLTAVKPVISIPMIAAGGIRDQQKMFACFERGASAVQIGTALLACHDCDAISESYRQRILHADTKDISITAAISGRCAQSIHNKLFHIMQRYHDNYPDKRLPYPLPQLLTAPLRAHAAKIDNAEWVSAWSGIDETKLKAVTIAECIHAFLT